MIVLDTHALIWLHEGNLQLGSQARALIDAAWAEDALAVSAISFWEASLLKQKGRIGLALPVAKWRQNLLDDGLIEIPLDGVIGIASTELEGFHPDPADRIIVATAIKHTATLITADGKILGWNGSVKCFDAHV